MKSSKILSRFIQFSRFSYQHDISRFQFDLYGFLDGFNISTNPVIWETSMLEVLCMMSLNSENFSNSYNLYWGLLSLNTTLGMLCCVNILLIWVSWWKIQNMGWFEVLAGVILCNNILLVTTYKKIRCYFIPNILRFFIQ